MQFGNKRIRKDFQPLTVACAFELKTPNSGFSQVYNSVLGVNQYEPDRTLTPTVVFPSVMAGTPDKSVPYTIFNSSLSNIEWYVDNVLISTAWSASDFEVSTTGDTKGTLTIKKNIDPDSKVFLKFKAVLSDSRLGVNIPIELEGLMLQVSAKTGDKYSIAFNGSNSILYNPFEDRLLDYDAKVKDGSLTASAAEKAKIGRAHV